MKMNRAVDSASLGNRANRSNWWIGEMWHYLGGSRLGGLLWSILPSASSTFFCQDYYSVGCMTPVFSHEDISILFTSGSNNTMHSIALLVH